MSFTDGHFAPRGRSRRRQTVNYLNDSTSPITMAETVEQQILDEVRGVKGKIIEIDRVLSQRLINAIAGLQEEPFPKGAVRVENEQFEREKVFRIRVGDYRILYAVNYLKNRMLIVNIDKRSRVY